MTMVSKKEEIYLLEDYKEYKAHTYVELFKSITTILIRENKAKYPPKELMLLVLDNFTFKNINYYKNEVLVLARDFANYLISEKHCINCNQELFDEKLSDDEKEAYKLEMHYYIAKLKGGHVGNERYFPFDMPIKAANLQEAKLIAIEFPRVKKHSLDDLIKIDQVNYEDYQNQTLENINNEYLRTNENTSNIVKSNFKKKHSESIHRNHVKKEINIKQNIGSSDLERKLSQGNKFLKKKYTVKFTVIVAHNKIDEDWIDSIFSRFNEMSSSLTSTIEEMKITENKYSLYYFCIYKPLLI